MPNRSVANDRLALNDFGNRLDIVFCKEDTNAFADSDCVATDGDEETLVADANPDIASETQDAFWS